MPQVQFAINSYKSRALPLSAQQVVNLFAQSSPKDAKSPVVLHGAPGIKTFCDNLGDGPIRGMHVMDGVLYVMSGCELFAISSDCTVVAKGSIEKRGPGEPGPSRPARMQFKIESGSAGGAITSIKINGDEILGSSIIFSTDTQTTAAAAAAAVSSSKYKAFQASTYTSTLSSDVVIEGLSVVLADNDAVVEIVTAGDMQIQPVVGTLDGAYRMAGG